MSKKEILYHYCRRFKENLLKFNDANYIKDKVERLFNLKELKGKNISTVGTLKVLRIGGTARVIIQVDKQIYYIRDVISQEDWVKTVATQVKKGFWLAANPLTDQEKNEAETHFRQILSVNEEDRPKPDPNDLWFKDFRFKLGLSVYEHEYWVKYTSSRHDREENIMIDDINLFHDALYNIYQDKNVGKEIKKGLYEYTTSKIGIFYTFIGDNILIYGGANLIAQRKLWDTLRQQDIPIPNSVEEIKQISTRAYPSYLLKPSSFEKWKNIQLNKENSNLSLMQEQIDFLQNPRLPFPAYINGQAGSGKSTMLYYIFANAYFYKVFNDNQQKLLFITENQALLDISKKEIKSLLLDNPEFGLIDNPEYFEGIDECFYTFKDFLLSIVPDEGRLKFNPNLYLDFATFRQKYLKSYKRYGKISPEQAWFVITTYLKGYGKEINANNYSDEVPSKSQAVSNEIVHEVEQNVLPFYEKLIKQEGYWDKIQLIQYIHQHINPDSIPKFDLIICDESQDFCRLELQFILKLSKLIGYDLSEINQVPIILAGDAYQTVNPTGYRVDEVKDIMYQGLKELSNSEYSPNWYEPQYNYRSAYPVVQLANKIQYYRKEEFKLEIKRPQKAKKSDFVTKKYYQNVCIDIKHMENDTLRQKLRYKTFIVPEEEIDKSKIPFFNADEIDIKNPVLAKGADYEQVVLFKFGDYYLNNVEKNADKGLIEKYFFNKLYVAITRAITELIIIDTEEGIEKFWKKKIEPIRASEEEWKEINEYEQVILFDVDTFYDIAESYPNTIREETLRDKERAILNKDSQLLHLCAKQFLRLGDDIQQYECLATAYELEEKWDKAIEYYTKVNNQDKIWHCHFQAKNLKILEKDHKLTKENALRYHILKLFTYNNIPTEEIEIIVKEIETTKKLLENVIWKKEFVMHLSSILETSDQSHQSKYVQSIIRTIDVLDAIITDYEIDERDSILDKMARICRKLEYNDKAIQIWHKIQNENEDENENQKPYFEKSDYLHAQLDVAKHYNRYDDMITWYGRLLDISEKVEEEIVIDYREKFNSVVPSLSKESLFVLGRAFLAYYNNTFESTIETSITEILNLIEQKPSNIAEKINFYEQLLSNPVFKGNLWMFLLHRWAKLMYAKNTQLDETNAKYREMAEKLRKVYIPFAENEIKSIPETITKISVDIPQHISGIVIKNFKRFKELKIHNVGRINLITGDNNVGKTSLLEALCFSDDISQFVQYQTYNYLQRKQSLLFEKESTYLPVTSEKLWMSIISKNHDSNSISYKLFKDRLSWDISIKAELVLKNNPIQFHKNKILENALLIPFGKLNNEIITQFYEDNIQGKKQLRNKLIEALRIFIPKIENIITNEETILIEEKEQEEGIPLYYYGDGVYKLFYIVMLTLMHPHKRIMIDEIDAGIHFSRLVRFWKELVNISDKFDVQIFATTHNIECIEALKAALEEDEVKIFQNTTRVITLYVTKDNQISARVRNFETFAEAVEEGYNLRGGE